MVSILTEIPGKIQSAVETINVEAQNAEKVNAASLLAENLEFEKSEAFDKLTKSIVDMHKDNKEKLDGIVGAIKDNKDLYVDVLLDKDSIGKAMKSYSPAGEGSKFAIKIGDEIR
jgi:hypothetical protein